MSKENEKPHTTPQSSPKSSPLTKTRSLNTNESPPSLTRSILTLQPEKTVLAYMADYAENEAMGIIKANFNINLDSPTASSAFHALKNSALSSTEEYKTERIAAEKLTKLLMATISSNPIMGAILSEAHIHAAIEEALFLVLGEVNVFTTDVKECVTTDCPNFLHRACTALYSFICCCSRKKDKE